MSQKAITTNERQVSKVKRRLKATPRFIMLLTLLCLVFAVAVFLSQNAKLNEIALEQSELEVEYAALQAEEQRLEYMIEYAKSDEYRVQYAREKLGLVLPDDIKFDITE